MKPPKQLDIITKETMSNIEITPAAIAARGIMSDIADREIHDVGCCRSVAWVLTSSAFLQGFGSKQVAGESGKHHGYRGGLAVHTCEVLRYALAAADIDVKVDRQVLATAAIWHDYAKIRDYNPDGTPAPYRDSIRHVSGSYAMWSKVCQNLDIPDGIEDAVGHCILSHHGRYEWGSPVEPQTIEAHLLHYADMISFKYGAGKYESS